MRLAPIVLFLVLAFGGLSCRPAKPAPRVTITSIHMSGMYADAARAMAKEFQRQTGIQVNIVDAPYLTLREKELTDLLNGTGQFDVVQVAQQWDGEILPLLYPISRTRLAETGGVEELVPSVRTNVGQWRGEIRAVPISADVITLVYRKDILEAVSKDFEREKGRPLRIPETWPEYLEVVRYLHSETLNGNIIMGLKEQNFGVWSGIFLGMGGALTTPDWQPGFDNEIGVRSLETFIEMFKYAPRESARLGTEAANSLFLQGKGAFYLTWPTLLWAQMQDTNLCKVTGKLGAALIPGSRPQLSSWSLGVNSHSRQQEAALSWILFFSNASNTKRLLLTYGKGSPRISTNEDEECRRQVFFVPQVYEGLKVGLPRPGIPESQELCDYLELQISEAVAGRISAREALSQAAARWRSILRSSGYTPATTK